MTFPSLKRSNFLIKEQYILKNILNFFDFLLPPRCLNCSIIISHTHNICPTCWKKLTFIEAPLCVQCGSPFPFKTKESLICNRCLKTSFSFEMYRSALHSTELSKSLLLSFKYGDKTYLAPLFAQWIFNIGRDILSKSDYLIPIPIHSSCLFKRQYNHVALLSNELSKKSNVPSIGTALLRLRPPSFLDDSSQDKSHILLKDVFKVQPKKISLIQNKICVLVDDTWNSGETLEACAQVLLDHGARGIHVLTVERAL